MHQSYFFDVMNSGLFLQVLLGSLLPSAILGIPLNRGICQNLLLEVVTLSEYKFELIGQLMSVPTFIIPRENYRAIVF